MAPRIRPACVVLVVALAAVVYLGMTPFAAAAWAQLPAGAAPADLTVAAPRNEGDPPVWPFAVATIAAVAVAAFWSTRRKP